MLVGCGDRDDEAVRGVDGTSWVLLTDSLDMEVPVDMQAITAEFGVDGRVSGSSGCNGYGGEYTAGGGRMTYERGFSTAASCFQPVDQIESNFLARLDLVAGYRFEGDKLILLDDDDTELLRFEPA
jgi:heat shock protein HslJ